MPSEQSVISPRAVTAVVPEPPPANKVSASGHGARSMVPAASRATRRWMLAALVAPALAVLAATGGPWQSLPPIIALMFAVGCGWAVVLLLAPWRTMRHLHPDRPLIATLVQQVRNITEGGRDVPMHAIVMDRPDEIGELSVLLHDLTVELIDSRRQARWLRKCMDDSIRRETDRATAHLQRQVNTDPLTNLGNRRTLEQRLDELANGHSPTQRLLSVMAIDLDHFKPINDALGHDVGDRCLVFLADLLRANLGPNDSAIRLGGDEFIVLLPQLSIEQAHLLAERLRSLHLQFPWPHQDLPRPTLSIGLSCDWPTTLDDAMDLVREADAALYESKRQGRARTTIFGHAREAA